MSRLVKFGAVAVALLLGVVGGNAGDVDGDAAEFCTNRLIFVGMNSILCVWKKTNAGMGSFYRSKHELVFVWKSGTAAHINNFELGQYGPLHYGSGADAATIEENFPFPCTTAASTAEPLKLLSEHTEMKVDTPYCLLGLIGFRACR
jgi:hypothetical protein